MTLIDLDKERQTQANINIACTGRANGLFLSLNPMHYFYSNKTSLFSNFNPFAMKAKMLFAS